MHRKRVGRRVVTSMLMAAVLLLASCGAGTSVATGAPAGALGTSSTRAAPATSSSSATVTTPLLSVGGTAAPSTTSVVPSPLQPKGTLTNADAGSTVHFRVGDTINLALKAADGFQNWEVAAPDAKVLKPTVNPAAAAVRGATLRAFQAVGVGQTDITATSKPTCAAGQACPQVVQDFKVTVIVDAG